MFHPIQKRISAIILAAVTASCLFSAPAANAGILFFASGYIADGFFGNKNEAAKLVNKVARVEEGAGVIMFVAGIAFSNPWLVILGEDGNLDQDALTQKLAAQYPELDALAISDLSKAITDKAAQTSMNADGQKTVNFSREDLATALLATNVQQAQPEVFNKIAADLQ